jgi:MFS family permease
MLFVLLGVVFATWASRIPAIREALQLSPAQLGLALLCAGAGSVGAFPLAAWLVGHHGPRRATWWSGTALMAVVAALGWAPNLAVLSLLMVGFGVFETTFNVAVNAAAARMEHAAGRSIMSRLHAWYCVGTFAGALAGSALAGIGLSAGLHFGAVTGLSWLLLALHCRALPPDHPDAAARGSRLTLPRGPLFALGIVCFCVAIAEGAITDWSGVYMRDQLGTTEGMAPLGFAAFSGLMLAVRWVADPLKDRWGARRIVWIGGLVAAAGVVLAAAAVNVPLTIIGFALAGTGIAAVFPFIFSAAGRHGSTALAGVATMGYSGVMIGPPVIGFVAHGFGLQAAMLTIAAITVAMALAGRRAKLLQ